MIICSSVSVHSKSKFCHLYYCSCFHYFSSDKIDEIEVEKFLLNQEKTRLNTAIRYPARHEVLYGSIH